MYGPEKIGVSGGGELIGVRRLMRVMFPRSSLSIYKSYHNHVCLLEKYYILLYVLRKIPGENSWLLEDPMIVMANL